MPEYTPRFRHAAGAFIAAVFCAIGASFTPSNFVILTWFLWGCVAFWMFVCVRIIGAILYGHDQEKKTDKYRVIADLLRWSIHADRSLVSGAAGKLGIVVPVPEIIYPERVVYQEIKSNSSGIEITQHDIYKVASYAQLQVVANGLLHGLRLRHDDFTPSRNGFSEGQFTRFQEYITDPAIRLAIWKNPADRKQGCIPTAEGEWFFATFETEERP